MRSTKSFLAAAAAFALIAGAACADSGTAPEAAGARAILQFTNQPPNAVVNLTVLGTAGCQTGVCWYNYEYDAYQSSDPDGTIASYKWVLNDGTVVSNSATWQTTALRAYEGCAGTTRGKLIVTDNAGAADTACFGFTPVN